VDDDEKRYREERAHYRDWLRGCRETASNSYDKAVLTLSGTGLAVSLGFLRAGAATAPSGGVAVSPLIWRGFLVASWVSFTLAMFSILISFRTSHSGYDQLLSDLEEPMDDERIHSGRPGGRCAAATDVLNYVALVCLFLGVLFFALFVWQNLERVV
jgi:hypothetical protein